MKLSPLPGTSKVDEVTRQLSQEITSGRFKDDTLLPTEPELIACFGVSRTVVREATKQLVTHGLVEIQRGRGVRVVKNLHVALNRSLELTLPDVKERLEKLLEVRCVIEPAVARLAATRASPVEIRELKETHASLKTAKDGNEAVLLDMEFHRRVVRCAGNPIFGLMLDSSADLGRASRLATITEVGWLKAFDHHQAILNAIERGKPGDAERAMIKHLEMAAADLRRHFST